MPKSPRRPSPQSPQWPQTPDRALAVIHNELARARYDQAVGVLALRLVVMLAEKIGYTDNELLGHRFKVTEYAALNWVSALFLKNHTLRAVANVPSGCPVLPP